MMNMSDADKHVGRVEGNRSGLHDAETPPVIQGMLHCVALLKAEGLSLYNLKFWAFFLCFASPFILLCRRWCFELFL